ncbi:MAG: hypothetical protein ACOCVR_03195, partial [Myxococcota bacterium]
MKTKLRLLPALLSALAVLLFPACSSSPPDAAEMPCVEDDTMCFEHHEYILECTEEGAWSVRECEDGTLCYEGECQELVCVPGTRSCEENSVVGCRDDGQGRLYPEPCGDDETCFEGECLPHVCEEGEARCADDISIERCVNGGTEFFNDTATTEIYTCDASGSWVAEPCPDGRPCLFGRCVSCVGHESCEEGQICEEGECVETDPVIVTDSLPAGTAGADYHAVLEVSGGLPPYLWELVEGELPDGIELTEGGELQGRPAASGPSSFVLRVTDQNAGYDERELPIEIVPAG